MIIIVLLQIAQTIVLAIYQGTVIDTLHFYLFLDCLLFVGLFYPRVMLILQLASLVNQFELNNHGFQLYIGVRMIEGAYVLQKKERLGYAVLTTIYVFIRLRLYVEPFVYVSAIGAIVLAIRDFVRQTNKSSSMKYIEMQSENIRQLGHLFEESLPLSMCIIQEEGFSFTTNQFKYEYADLTPDLIQYLATPSTKQSLGSYLKRLVSQGGTPYQCINTRTLESCSLEKEGYCNPKGTQRFPIDIKVSEIFWDSKPGIMLTFGSQTEKQIKEDINQMKIQDMYKDELLASVSHDFKTPINGMVAIVQYLEDCTVDEHQLYHLRIIRKNAYLLLFMISDILDFSRIQKNQLRLCNSTFHIQNIVDEIIELISLQASQKGIEIKSYFSVKNGLMFSDPNRIKQILLNLLSNSLKFTEKGRIEVHVIQDLSVNLNQNDIKSKVITIIVTDTGVGIPEHIKPKLFKMYGTFDINRGLNRHGIGLGLVICKKLVGLLGPTDDINLESQLGIGTKFSFQILLNNDQTQKQTNDYMPAYNQEQSPQKMEAQPCQNYTVGQNVIFNRPITQLKQNLKQLNKKTFTQTDIPRSSKQIQVQTMACSAVSKIPRKSSDILLEDKDNSKTSNIQSFILKRKRSVQTYGGGSMKKQVSEQFNEPVEQNTQFLQELDKPNTVITDMICKLFAGKSEILVVDDQAVNVFAFKLILRKYPFINVHEAFNGEQAIAKVVEMVKQNKMFSYIFMDLTMPIMNGYIAAEKLRFMESNNMSPRNNIIALTGYDDSKEKERCQKAGFDAFITKPIKIVDIIQVLQEIQKDVK